MKEFWEKYYKAERMTLVIVSDFEFDFLQKHVSEIFNQIPCGIPLIKDLSLLPQYAQSQRDTVGF